MKKKELYHKINPNSLGDALAATPTLRKISKSYDQKINVVTHVPELFKNNPYVKNIYSFEQFNKLKLSAETEVFETFCGCGVKNNNGVEKKHNLFDIRRFHSVDLGFDLLDTEMHYDFVPDLNNNYHISQKYICLHAATSWESRTYSKENWQNLINELEKLNYFIVIVGKNATEHGFWNIDKKIHSLSFKNGLDLSNKLNLSELWHVLNNSEYVITMDSGILHFAGTTDTFIIQLGSSINNKLRAPYRNNSQDYKYKYISGPCDIFCGSDMKYGIKEWGTINSVPPLVKCLENKSTFECHSKVSDVVDFIKTRNVLVEINNTSKKYLFIAGHLSTGGGPKYLEWLIKKIKNEGNTIKVVEWNLYSPNFIVQRNEIIDTIGKDNFISVGSYYEDDSTFYDKEKNIKNYINDFAPDYIHLNDLPEEFAIKPMSKDFLEFLYKKDRSYKILETCHTSQFDFNKKIYIPDAFWFCSDYHLKLSKNINVPKKIVEMDLPLNIRPNRDDTLKELGLDPSYYHVLQVGLFHKNKNQKFTFDVAKNFLDDKILFHFVGNMCYIDECDIDRNQKNCMIWGERDDVQKFMSCMDLFVMPSLQELNPISIKEALSWNMKCFISDLDVYRDKYKDNNNISFIKEHNLLQYIVNLPLSNISESYVENFFFADFRKPVRIEISGNNSYKYDVKFINKLNNKIFYESLLTNNMWAASEQESAENVKIIMQNLTTKQIFNFEKSNDRKVCVANESGSLGDTLAWTPVVNRFAVENNITIDYFTPYKNLFETKYPNVNFHDYSDKNNISTDSEIYELKFDCGKLDNTKNLQEIASDILNIYHKEERPQINIAKPFKKNFNKKYVCIATHSTSQFKYWNNPIGWQQTVDYLKSIGYDVICIDKQEYFGTDKKMNCIPKGCINKTGDISLQERMNDLHFCDFFIGLTSGLSWLAWSLEKPVVLISGISKENTEFFTPYRVTNTNVCHGCATEKGYEFDRDDWMFCPKNKNFECTSSITFEMVKEQIDKLIKDHNLK
jgi:autotransporter strand-loop-strand O-heptosyltransferase